MPSVRGWALQYELDGEIDILFDGRQKQNCFDHYEAERYLRRHAERDADGKIHYTQIEPDGYRTKRSLR